MPHVTNIQSRKVGQIQSGLQSQIIFNGAAGCSYWLLNKLIFDKVQIKAICDSIISSLPFGASDNTRKKLTFKQVTKRSMAYVVQKSYNIKKWYKDIINVEKENNDIIITKSYMSVCFISFYMQLPASFTVCTSKLSMSSSEPCKNAGSINKRSLMLKTE